MLEDKRNAGGAKQRQPRRPLQPGDAAPRLCLPDATGNLISPLDDAHAGRPAVVVFAQLPEAAEDLALLLQSLNIEEDSRLFVAARPQLPAVPPGPAGAIWLADTDGAAAAAQGFAETALAAAACDANGRLVALESGPPAAQAAALAAAFRSLAQPACAEGIAAHPPVLVLPRVLSPDHCARLLAEWERPVRLWPSDGFTSLGYEEETTSFKLKVESYGELVQLVVRDPPLEGWLDGQLSSLRREIHKAFRIRTPMREEYRIVCYDADDSGYLGRHRDNPTKRTRHRLFTAVVALNDANAYEGGELCFPEYAASGYRPAKGTAIVWSASLLHEVRPVTSGQRFVLGTHLGQ